jgi:helix-turn-helix protein
MPVRCGARFARHQITERRDPSSSRFPGQIRVGSTVRRTHRSLSPVDAARHVAMQDNIDAAIRGAAAAIEHLVRILARDELRRHLGSEAEQLINVKAAPMSPRKLRELVRAGELPGFKRGRDTFVRASDLRSWIEGDPWRPRRLW